MSHQSPWETTNLEALEQQAWQALVRGAHDPKHAFHWPTLVTTSPDGLPEARTVVLRHVERAARQLALYTDVRSSKLEAIRAQPVVAWHLYDGKRRVQLRVKTLACIHHNDDLSRQKWDALPASGRYAYCHQPPPGTPQNQWHPGPPERWLDATPELAETEGFYENFAVVYTDVHALEVLYLAKRGHYRARFMYDDPNEVVRTWLVP